MLQPAAMAGDQRPRTIVDRLGHPTVGALDRRLVDHRSEIGLRVKGTADLHATDALDETSLEVRVDVAYDVDALDADAHLAGIGE